MGRVQAPEGMKLRSMARDMRLAMVLAVLAA